MIYDDDDDETPRKSNPSKNDGVGDFDRGERDRQSSEESSGAANSANSLDASNKSTPQATARTETIDPRQRATSKRTAKTKKSRRGENRGNDNPRAKRNDTKRKRNGRLVRLVSLGSSKDDRDETAATTSSTTRTTSVPPLPGNQYTATLRRRAVRKAEGNSAHPDNECGDISLGMKLIVAGGRVIVQSLISLSEGLASPAQLAGVIHRGDVLLAIGNLSLTNLPIDQLMEGLRPLSTPDSAGCYQRILDLRFEAGAGLNLLKLHEEEHTRPKDSLAPDPIFSIFPMVDNLSGLPLYEPQYDLDAYQTPNGGENKVDVDVDVVEEAKDKFPGDEEMALERRMTEEGLHKLTKDLNCLISATLAKERNSDRERYESEYFDWREDFPELLRRTISIVAEAENGEQLYRLTKKERLELGLKIMQTAKALELSMEEIDKGYTTRANKNWSSGGSLRSISSATVKRQYNMDGTITSYRLSCDNVDEDSIDSDGSLDEVDPDKLLLGLAARDEIWRKQVLSILDVAIDDMENRVEEKLEDSVLPAGGMDLTQQLGHFLFRENSAKVPKQVKSFSFPPPEITRVLFDLTTYIAAGANDDVTVFGASSKLSSHLSSFRSGTTSRSALFRADTVLATQFILDEALPHWLKAFRPLKVEDRAFLWPTQSNRGDSLSAAYTRSSDGDSLTLDSGGSTHISTAQNKKKEMREYLDYHAANNESRPELETCFLVTYFYTQKIVGTDLAKKQSIMNQKSFVETYGAYLQIPTCLSFAASVKDEVAISAVLEASRSDPSHRDAMREIEKSNASLFYNSGKLSALLQCLKGVRFELEEERRKILRDMCVSAYPDIQSWQVRDACLSLPKIDSNETREHSSDDTMEALYYSYLSHLLNPVDGHESARQDLNLVKEFCEWSVGVLPRKEKKITCMENFLNVASPSSSLHNSYRRDLMMLLNLSMTIENHDLALDLVDEILENKKLASNKEAVRRIACCLRTIGGTALASCSDTSKDTTLFEGLIRPLSLFEKMSTNQCSICQRSINLPEELFTLFNQWKVQTGSNGDDPKMYLLIDFVVESSKVPGNVIRALILWSGSNKIGCSLYSRVERLLCRGIHFAASNGELSGTLLRLKNARATFRELDDPITRHDSSGEKTKPSPVGIWGSMAEGALTIEK
ncbi:unnamed protein product [Pseudo-nitzschia multistriata]|uniref:PDZ domain-containing protein n=1 Tax=Pseudo-nitzschia multistriata TaxID=183589 RepID=A0A448ZD22_9STRA|nr:unnamed protein product [Pseudo-nitzschia multistriata]